MEHQNQEKGSFGPFILLTLNRLASNGPLGIAATAVVVSEKKMSKNSASFLCNFSDKHYRKYYPLQTLKSSQILVKIVH